ncbi:ABC transporter ATP-binding protein [Scytonema sp. NUACC26]|uniref:ABC transporter ATP-binding protein n=1 Tax=Scytonema sp. NUACC26 TaxID=3140176 RepID=UPI0034DC5A32
MSDTVIRVENLGKKYIIGHQQQERYTALRDVIANNVKALLNPFQKEKSQIQNSKEEFWALKDVSFEIKQGDRVGIIGRNGAGKSTLLKILSRITEPTTGSVRIKGRVASLLEVGTGFHPELTGRENIFLNGAILGMSKAEITKKFDEIVAFAEVEKFLDTPVKRYSSGMYVRLAFAVAAHLEPEILVVDEVLAVGDAAFQKKCLGKMEDVGKEGRTVLFVSHNMSAIRSLCTLAIALSNGTLKDIGEINNITDKYLADISKSKPETNIDNTKYFNVHDVQISSPNNLVIKTFDLVEIKIVFSGKTNIIEPDIYISISTIDGNRLVGINFRDFQPIPPLASATIIEAVISIQSLPLLPGQYHLEVQMKDNALHRWEFVPKAFLFEVIETPIYGSRKIDSWFGYIGLKINTTTHTY